MDFAVLNLSTRFSSADAMIASKAVAEQLRLHVAPSWHREPAAVEFTTEEKASGPSYPIAIVDDADQATAKGWHKLSPQGQVYGRIFVGPILDNGGQPLHGSATVAAAISHEIIETFCDPYVNLWATNADGELYAVEVCDPVEGDVYDLAVEDHAQRKQLVSVANFVYPEWFMPVPSAKVDYLGHLNGPFQIAGDGYAISMQGGTTSPHFGIGYPEWRRIGKTFPASRSARRAPAAFISK